jgi:hypothetical protein
MTLFIMKFPPATYYFIPVRSKYSSQHPVLEPPAHNFPLMLETKCHIYIKL